MHRNAQTVAPWENLEIKMSVLGVAIFLKDQSFFFPREQQRSAINSHWLW